ncbi:hypothetical protein ACIRPQ_17415 [Streptomyces sp. NPDC101213]|uniref:hypothetical protein n=1 Tax=unclassified Streptomyces TaxID=2593676 RepID=UPI0036F8F0BD|nr:hypothetical protein [Streptomyces sp. Tue 6430]
MTQQDRSVSSPGDGETHTTTTVERGPFCLARCTCGWHGPARRARSLARTDAAGHTHG